MQHALDAFVLIRRLWQLGYIVAPTLWEALELSEAALRKVIEAYQRFNRLTVDGWAGPETKASLEAPRFCGFPDLLPIQAAEAPCRWRKPRVGWSLLGSLPGLSVEQLQEAYRLAAGYWNEVCNIQMSSDGGSSNADIVASVGPIDGGMGTLAWSELPCAGDDRQLRQLYDQNESWVVSEQPRSGQIDLVRVACHELGHALGIPHIAAGNLMAPVYSIQIRKPQAGDVAEAVKRYGPVPPPPAEEVVVMFAQPVTKLILRRVF